MAEAKSNSFIETEHEVLKFWEENDCYNKRKAKNEGKERFRFIDGPITANNPMGIHHAWGRTLKDTFIRYKYIMTAVVRTALTLRVSGLRLRLKRNSALRQREILKSSVWISLLINV